MRGKYLITSVLSLSMIATTLTPAFAASANEIIAPLPGQGQSNVTLEVKDTNGGGGNIPDGPDTPPIDPTDIIIATVPLELPIVMDLEGNITVPTDAKIINHSSNKIQVTDIEATLESGWSIASDVSTASTDTKEIGLSFRGDKLGLNGLFDVTPGNWNIPESSELPLSMSAEIPLQTVESKGKIATISFTIAEGHAEEIPPVKSTLTADWENGLLLPGSKKTATLNWDSTNQNDRVVNLESSNSNIATIPDLGSIATPMSETSSYKGSLPVEITAVSRGTSTITATLESGATTTFDVLVSEVNNSGESKPSGEVKPDSSFNEGDTLNPDDVTVTIPVVKPDGSTEDIVVTPDIVPDTPLVEGENNIEITVDVNGVKVVINIVINIASSNPSNGLTQSVVDAQAMGFSFTPYESGLEITSFENKQFKSEVNVPEQIGDFKVLKLGDNVFKGQTNLKKVTLPGTITKMGAYTFEGCSNLTDIIIPSTIVELGESCFKGCSKLDLYIDTDIESKDSDVESVYYDTFNKVGSLHLKSLTSLPTYMLMNYVKVDGDIYVGDNKVNYTSDYIKVVSTGNLVGFESTTIQSDRAIYLLAVTNDEILDMRYYKTETSNYRDVVTANMVSHNMEGSRLPHTVYENICCGTYNKPKANIKINFSNIADGTPPLSLASYNISTAASNIVTMYVSRNHITKYMPITVSVDRDNIIEYDVKEYSDGTCKIVITPKYMGTCNLTVNTGEWSKVCKITVTAKEAFDVQRCWNMDEAGYITGMSDFYKNYKNPPKEISVPYIINGKTVQGFKRSSGDIKHFRYETEKITLHSSIPRIGDFAFAGLRNLKEVVLPKNLTGSYNIGQEAFSGCTSLEKITLPSGIESLGLECFNYCTSLNTVVLPSTIKGIGEKDFNNCQSLKQIEIPSSITSIDSTSFSKCTDIVINIHKSQNSIKGAPWGATNATVNWLG